ncbi:hypothetical protein SAMN06265349_1011270 [Flavobacterium resistens]|uniref:DUF3375 family protein n=1 Tax=Flavobacterium resistens TaxID=443612 RepID=A0A521BNV9_9FLAO|nr:hypothetical protein [Flavobacterium resistens]MRX67575.1 hypothetical protein [Flavobacterium resistens]SMO48812.1 hypothetical protein SAMN06265349_1011270 [Flavobacterium resistens]
MMEYSELYLKYDLLLPSKFDGGFLIIAIYEKIKAGEIDEYFTVKEINEILKDISIQFEQDSVRQWGNIKDNLFHYFFRNHPDEPWKYYLTDYAKNVVDLMVNKLENPYKNHPLKKSFEDSFIINFNEITSIDVLERKFGRIFIQGSKKIIVDHLESLEDELRDSYKDLNDILQKDEQDATILVKEFTLVFRKFGVKAEDITNAILSKDKFLDNLQSVIDLFYQKMNKSLLLDKTEIDKNINDWERGREVYADLKDFFNSVDNKVNIIRRQINHASEKLSELQEQFSTRSHFRLQIKKFFKLALENTKYTESGAIFENGFPLKALVFESTSILYPRHYDFNIHTSNIIINIKADENYAFNERLKIVKEIDNQQRINNWVAKAKDMLQTRKELIMDELMTAIANEEEDESIAYQVASQMVSYASEDKEVVIDIKQELISLDEQNISLWKTRIKK